MMSLFTTRWGTAALLLVWLGSFGLAVVAVQLLIVPATLAVCAAFALAVAGEIRQNLRFEATLSFSGETPRKNLKLLPFWLPVSEKAERHNARAKTLRKIDRLAEQKRECENLVCEFKSDPMKVAVLEGERDAAERQIERLEGDIRLLEQGWEMEDRERRYREITGG